MEDWQHRTRMLLGDDKTNRLSRSVVFILGVGGVGGFTAEFLARAGIGKLILIDADTIKPSNRNRQIHALTISENQLKVLALKERLLLINPDIKVECHNMYYDEENEESLKSILLSSGADFAVDAIDTLGPKVSFIRLCLENNIPLISSLGAAGKLDPSKVMVSPIEKTNHCRLAYTLRKRLHRFDIRSGFDAVFSAELVDKEKMIHEKSDGKASTVGTISYMPAVFAVHITAYVIQKITD
jgi:tRNA A37 threonylcarbamoyladenosine dehydratase